MPRQSAESRPDAGSLTVGNALGRRNSSVVFVVDVLILSFSVVVAWRGFPPISRKRKRKWRSKYVKELIWFGDKRRKRLLHVLPPPPSLYLSVSTRLSPSVSNDGQPRTNIGELSDQFIVIPVVLVLFGLEISHGTSLCWEKPQRLIDFCLYSDGWDIYYQESTDFHSQSTWPSTLHHLQGR